LRPPQSESKASGGAEGTAADKLVLTPALRVADTPQADDAAETGAAEPDAADQEAEERDAASSTSAAPTGEAQSDDTHGDTRLEAAAEALAETKEQDAPDPADEVQQDDTPEIAEEATADDAAAEDDVTDAPAPDESPREMPETDALAARIAELEAAVSGHADAEWEPDNGAQGFDTDMADAVEWEDVEPETDAAPEMDGDAKDAEAPQEPAAADDTAERMDALLTKVKAAATPTADPADTADTSKATPDPVHAQAAPADPARDEDDMGETVAAGAGSSALLAEEAGPDLFGGDDAVIDEEALRDLVAEIVRQELQGSLGERITRNVRKLVRREIHRALTAQELE